MKTELLPKHLREAIKETQSYISNPPLPRDDRTKQRIERARRKLAALENPDTLRQANDIIVWSSNQDLPINSDEFVMQVLKKYGPELIPNLYPLLRKNEIGYHLGQVVLEFLSR